MFTLIVHFMARTGVGGVFLLMLLENLVPAIPSELILPLAGYSASQGAMSPVAAAVAGAAGSALGGWAWYEAGRAVGRERVRRLVAAGGRWVAITPDEIDKANALFQRFGGAAVCVGRMLPGVRGVICIPAGMARMDRGRFLVWSTVGATVWSALLVACGMALGARYGVVKAWINPVADSFLVICIGVYLWRIIRPRRSAKAG